MLNNVTLVGRLTADPELKEVGENKVCNFSVAVQRSYKNADGNYEADFINCSVWNQIAENLCEYCHKGDIVGIKGSLMQSNYEKDGVKHYKLEVKVEKVTFLSSKKEVTE